MHLRLCGVEDFTRRNFESIVLSTPEERDGWLDETKKIVQSDFLQGSRGAGSVSELLEMGGNALLSPDILSLFGGFKSNVCQVSGQEFVLFLLRLLAGLQGHIGQILELLRIVLLAQQSTNRAERFDTLVVEVVVELALDEVNRLQSIHRIKCSNCLVVGRCQQNIHFALGTFGFLALCDQRAETAGHGEGLQLGGSPIELGSFRNTPSGGGLFRRRIFGGFSSVLLELAMPSVAGWLLSIGRLEQVGQ